MAFTVLRGDSFGGNLRCPLDRPQPLTPWERGAPHHPAPSSSRHGQHGFTLIELLISLTVMAVILMLIGGALRVMGRNWDANAARIETLDMVSRAFDLFARDAANLQRITMPSDALAYLFSGTAESLAFVALEPPRPGEAGLYFIAYTLEPNGGNAELVRSRARWRQGMERFPGATPANRVPLLTGPYVYRFAYGSTVGGKQSWSADWTFANRLPDLIRLDVLDRSGARALGPPMIVRTRADAELDCLALQPALCSAKTGGALQVAKTGAPQPPERGQR
jgi:general secretion pathway protein J